MKNIEKYTNTKDALEAYNAIGLKNVPFDVWLEHEYEEPRVPTLLEAADAVACSWFDDDKIEALGVKICTLIDAIDCERRKPVRNLDKYRTAEEAQEAFDAFCAGIDKCEHCRLSKFNGRCSISFLYGESKKDVKK